MKDFFRIICVIFAIPFALMLYLTKVIVYAGYFYLMFGWPYWIGCIVFSIMTTVAAIGLFYLQQMFKGDR